MLLPGGPMMQLGQSADYIVRYLLIRRSGTMCLIATSNVSFNWDRFFFDTIAPCVRFNNLKRILI